MLAKLLLVTLAIAIIGGCSSGGTGTPGNSKAGLKVVFASNGVQSVIPGTTGTVLVSTDMQSWSPVSIGTTEQIRKVRYLNNLYVALGLDGGLYTSADGLSWQKRYANTAGGVASGASTPNELADAAYNGSVYVVVGFRGLIISSPDAVTWTARNAGITSGDNDITSITYGAGRFVAVGGTNSSLITSSTDGISWSYQGTQPNEERNDIVFGGNQFVVVCSSQNFYTSPDGVNWTLRNAGASALYDGVTFANGLYVVTGKSVTSPQTAVIMTSPDGITWTTRTSAITSPVFQHDVSYDSNVFVSYAFTAGTQTPTIAITGVAVQTSSDGISWTQKTVSSGAPQQPASTTTMQDLGIHRVTMTVTPNNSASFTPSPIDLTSYITGASSVSVPNLTDNESYTFRVDAYDAADKLIYQGSVTAVMLPAPATNPVSIVCSPYKTAAADFTAAVGKYDGTLYNADGSINDTFTLTIDTNGKVTGSNTLGNESLSGALTVSSSTVYSFNGTATDTTSGNQVTMTGTLDTASGHFTGTAASPVGTKKWIAVKSKVGIPFSIAKGWIGGAAPLNSSSLFVVASTTGTNPSVMTSSQPVPQALGTSGLPLDGQPPFPTSVVKGTNNYLVVWTEINSALNTSYVIGRLLDLNGVPTGSPITIAATTPAASPRDPRVAFDGTNYFVVWSQNNSGLDTDLEGRFVSASGVPGSGISISAVSGGVNETGGSVVFGNGVYHVAYMSGQASVYNVFVRDVTTAGMVSALPVKVNSSVSNSWNPTNITFDGTNLLVTMHLNTTGGTNTDYYGRLLLASALAPKGGEIVIANTPNTDFGSTAAFDGTKYLLTWTEFGSTSAVIYGKYLTPTATGYTIDAQPFVIAGNAAIGGCNYLSASSQYLCSYHTYSSYTPAPQTLLSNLTGVVGVYVTP